MGPDNIEVRTQSDICMVASDYFENLFESKQGVYNPVLNVIQPCITDYDNELLLAPFNQEEIKNTLFSMDPNKSPGPDGLNPAFYRKFWDMCGMDIFMLAVIGLKMVLFLPILMIRILC